MGEARNRTKRKTGPHLPGAPKKVSISRVHEADFVESAVANGLLDGIAPAQAGLARITSIRAYRRILDRALHWTLLGRISTGQLREIVVAAKEGASLLMTEKILAAKGLIDDEPAHQAGPDGGVTLPAEPPTEPRRVTVERTTGVGATGELIDTTTVTIEGGPDLAAEVPAIGGNSMHVPEALPTPQDEDEDAALSMSARLTKGYPAPAQPPRDPFLDPGEVEPHPGEDNEA